MGKITVNISNRTRPGEHSHTYPHRPGEHFHKDPHRPGEHSHTDLHRSNNRQGDVRVKPKLFTSQLPRSAVCKGKTD